MTKKPRLTPTGVFEPEVYRPARSCRIAAALAGIVSGCGVPAIAVISPEPSWALLPLVACGLVLAVWAVDTLGAKLTITFRGAELATPIRTRETPWHDIERAWVALDKSTRLRLARRLNSLGIPLIRRIPRRKTWRDA